MSINITSPNDSKETSKSYQGRLSLGAIISLVAGLGVLLIATITILFVYVWRHDSKQISKVNPPFFCGSRTRAVRDTTIQPVSNISGPIVHNRWFDFELLK